MDFKTILVFGLPSIAGVFLATLGIITGNYLNKKMEGAKLKKGFGFFVLAMAIIIFIEQFFFSNLIN